MPEPVHIRADETHVLVRELDRPYLTPAHHGHQLHDGRRHVLVALDRNAFGSLRGHDRHRGLGRQPRKRGYTLALQVMPAAHARATRAGATGEPPARALRLAAPAPSGCPPARAKPHGRHIHAAGLHIICARHTVEGHRRRAAIVRGQQTLYAHSSSAGEMVGLAQVKWQSDRLGGARDALGQGRRRRRPRRRLLMGAHRLPARHHRRSRTQRYGARQEA